MRNRCQELLIKFNQDETSTFADAKVSSQPLREGSIDWQLCHLQADHDLIPLQNWAETVNLDPEFNIPVLGKRDRDSELKNNKPI